ncbi:hypothetical protein SBRCBS47491_000594 [Sporothrix bragantina]|uniref:Rhodopsin domain-containing protein n=1 Tax=Sporothrix bragantina TaxID=671064 RepID=A0ABP0ARK2_9PEZI
MATEDYASALLVVSVLMIILTTMAIIMRLTVRLGVLGGLGWDDTLVGVSWAFAMILFSTTIAARQNGFGMHLDLVPIDDQSTVSKVRQQPSTNLALGYECSHVQLILVCSVAYSVSGPAVKAAFCILYLRILRGRTLATLNKVLIAFFAAQAIEECLVTVFQCSPVQKAWLPTEDGRCYSLVPLFYCTFVFNLITELILFLQPIPTMWHLQVPVAKRIGVIVMLSLGLLVCIISIIRMVYFSKIGTDKTYDYSLPMIWSQVEVSALIFCSCIPYSRQVVQRVPWLSRLVGFHAPHGGGAGRDGAGSLHNNHYYHHNTNKSAGRTLSMALQKRLQNPSGNVVGVPLPSQVDSTDEIIPYRPNFDPNSGRELDLSDKELVAMATAAGAIVVTHDITYEYEYDERDVADARNNRNEIEESPSARTIVYTGESSDDDDDGGDRGSQSTAHASDDSTEYPHKDKVTEDV